MSNNEHYPEQPTLWDESTADSTPMRRRERPRPEATPPRQSTAPANPQPHPAGERLRTAADVAAYLGVPIKTVYAWRSRGRGPKGFRIGKHLRWRRPNVTLWSLTLFHDEKRASHPAQVS